MTSREIANLPFLKSCFKFPTKTTHFSLWPGNLSKIICFLFILTVYQCKQTFQMPSVRQHNVPPNGRWLAEMCVTSVQDQETPFLCPAVASRLVSRWPKHQGIDRIDLDHWVITRTGASLETCRHWTSFRSDEM